MIDPTLTPPLGLLFLRDFPSFFKVFTHFHEYSNEIIFI